MSDPRMFEVIAEPGQKPIKMWTRGVQLEDAARAQLMNVAKMPFIHSHVAVMPDVHWGMGATVGSVIPTRGAVIPAAVGVDIGCGMIYQRTSLRAEDLPDSLLSLRLKLEEMIPHGRTDEGGSNDKGAWQKDVPSHIQAAFISQKAGLDRILEKYPKIENAAKTAPRHVGTLGGGNHFVELVIDEEGQVGIMLHSGSRGIGNRIGSIFIQMAKEDMRTWHINLPDADLAYLPEGTQKFDDYFEAVSWAQAFAKTNRDAMMTQALIALKTIVSKPFTLEEQATNCHHNYVTRERWDGHDTIITRKGAVSAKKGEMGIIPGSMGARSYIVRGLGNRDSFCSCSHGAGRAMSRGEAKRQFTLADHAAATQGVECRKDEDVIDETPMAYKDIDAVMAAQSDLVEIVHTVKQVLCVKG